MNLRLANATTYFDVYALTGFASGKSIVVHNETSSPIFLAISPTAPTNDSQAIAIETGETYSFSPKTSKLWVRGSTGPIRCEILTSALASQFERVDLPQDVYTSDTEGYRRLRVDSGQTGFFEGREFRTFYELSITSGTSVYLRVTSPIDFILFEQSLTLDSGSVRFTAITGGTPSGTFSTQLPIIGKNRMVARKTPFYTSQITVAAGGGVSGGSIVELFRVVAANATAQQQTVLGASSTERGLPAGTYFLRLENIGNGTATGVYSLIWEERPVVTV